MEGKGPIFRVDCFPTEDGHECYTIDFQGQFQSNYSIFLATIIQRKKTNRVEIKTDENSVIYYHYKELKEFDWENVYEKT
jgi:hypothetical protein